MPRESLAREKLHVSTLIGRLASIFLIACVGGVAIGAILGVASGIHIRFFWSVSTSSSVSVIFISILYGVLIFGIIGVITSPLLVLALYRGRYSSDALFIYKTCGWLALLALIFPPLGILVVAGAFITTCAYCARAGPFIWPAIVPPGFCVGCGYDLHGIDADNCPECARHRNRPLECRVCSRAFAWPWPTPKSQPQICSGCGHDLTANPLCQRCGNNLQPDAATCPGCHRPIGIPPKA